MIKQVKKEVKASPKQYWKITNIYKEPIKFIIATSPSTSAAVLLKEGEFVISLAKQTATIDAQIRRKYITVDKNFNNDAYSLNTGKPYKTAELETFKMEKATADAKEYKKKG